MICVAASDNQITWDFAHNKKWDIHVTRFKNSNLTDRLKPSACTVLPRTLGRKEISTLNNLLIDIYNYNKIFNRILRPALPFSFLAKRKNLKCVPLYFFFSLGL